MVAKVLITMTYMVTATRGATVMASSARTALSALEWIRSRRAVGAGHFNVVDDKQHRVEESELAELARGE
jgi:hypothetical protein